MKEQRRRKVRPKRKSIRWGRILIALVVAIALVGALIIGIRSLLGVASSTDTSNNEIQNLPAVNATASVDLNSIKTSYMLIVGVDSSQPQQADAIYLVAFNMDAKTMQIIGIPSNSKIINRHNDEPQQINTMYTQGGLELTKAVVEDMFHITIPYYAVVDRNSFHSMLEIFGTPSLYVEKSMVHRDDTTGQIDINIHQGYQDLTSETAYGYMRYLDDGTNTLTRTMHQERLLKAIFERERNHVSLGTAFRVWRQWSHMSTNVSTWDGIRLLTKVVDFPKEKVRWYILPGSPETIKGVDYWNVDPIELQQLVGITVGDIPIDGEVTPVIGEPPKHDDKNPQDDIQRKNEDGVTTEPGSPTSR